MIVSQLRVDTSEQIVAVGDHRDVVALFGNVDEISRDDRDRGCRAGLPRHVQQWQRCERLSGLSRQGLLVQLDRLIESVARCCYVGVAHQSHERAGPDVTRCRALAAAPGSNVPKIGDGPRKLLVDRRQQGARTGHVVSVQGDRSAS